MALPSDINYDEKKLRLHKFDSLLLLLYTFLLSLTVVTIWLFKHRRVAFIHETGLAIVYGLIIGAIIRFGVQEDNEINRLTVIAEEQRQFVKEVNLAGPPEELYLKTHGKVDNEFKNKTWVYDFKGEVRDAAESEIDEKAVFDPELFFNILLPPIIFHAGYDMKRRYFFRNLGSIFTFAFVGTVISTFTVGGCMYGVTQLFPHLNNITFIDNLHFGALISATDPVTVLAIFNDLHVDVNLHAIVFGESVLNDAVAIVFTETLKDYEENVAQCDPTEDCTYSAIHLVKAVLDFCGIFGASFLVGSLMGCVTALLTKFTHIRQHPLLESTLFVLMSYSTFLLAEVFELTGIVAVLFCGITQAHYTYNNLSKQSKQSTKQFFDLLNFMAENFIFSYIGVSMFTFPKHHFDAAYIVGAFLAIFFGRALNVYPLSAVLNLGRKHKISGNVQHMMMFSGLRGAIAFALAIRNTMSESRQIILSTTLLIVIITVIVNGGTTFSVLRWLGIPTGVQEDPTEHGPIVNSPIHDYQSVAAARSRSSDGGGIGGVEENGGVGGGSDLMSDSSSELGSPTAGGPGGPTLSTTAKPDKSWLARQWSGTDKRFVKPFLTHSQPTLMETLPERCLPLARFFTSTEQMMGNPRLRREEAASTDTEAGPFDQSDSAAASKYEPNGNESATLSPKDL